MLRRGPLALPRTVWSVPVTATRGLPPEYNPPEVYR